MTFLSRAGLAAGLLLVSSVPLGLGAPPVAWTSSLAGPAGVPQTLAEEWRDSPALPGAPLEAGAAPTEPPGLAQYSSGYQYTSEVHAATFVFNAIAVKWKDPSGAGDSELFLRVSADGVQWSRWRQVRADDDVQGSGVTQVVGELAMVAPSRYAQYRLTWGSTAAEDIRLVFLNTLQGPSAREAAAGASVGKPAPGVSEVSGGPLGQGQGVAAPRIITRSQWGANESYRTWAPDYYWVSKFVIHHTVTDTGGNDPAAVARAIYYYHAVIVGWGDIGYNYLVDWMGNIYEGRYGGPNAVGAHAAGHNEGADGIAIVGDYSTTVPSDKALAWLVQLLAWRAANQGVDPLGHGFFVDKDLPNIMGHRDAVSTLCPGDAFYALLPAVRQRVASALGYTPSLSAQVSRVAFLPARLAWGDVLRVDVTVTNTGTVPLQTQDPSPGFLYQEGDPPESRGYPGVAGAFRVGVDTAGSTVFPYRWGLGSALAPGASATISGYVRVQALGDRRFWVGLVQEKAVWPVRGTGGSSVEVYRGGAASYTAVSQPSTTVYLPLIMNGANGWATTLVLQNASDSATDATITFYDSAGKLATSAALSLPPNGSRIYPASVFRTLPASFVGSAVVQSATPVAAVVNEDKDGFDRLAYEGFSTGAPRLYAPLLFKNYNGWSTGLQVQNLGRSAATVTVTYVHNEGSGGSRADSASVAPGAFATFYQPSSDQLPDGFVGSAIVTAAGGQPLAALVNEVGAGGTAMSYAAPADGSAAVAVPLVFKGYHGWNSGLQVQNLGDSASSISVTYYDGAGHSWQDGALLAAGTSVSFYQPSDQRLPGGLVGSALVRSSAQQPLAVAVNAVRYDRRVGTAYTGFRQGSPVLFAPLVYRNADGWSTGVQVQNLGDSSAAVTVSYFDAGGSLAASDQATVAAGASVTFYQPANARLPDGFVGSAVVMSDGAPLGVVVNEVR